jgi:sec-independent protein translocase protein TatC
MPVVSYLLARLGLLSSAFLARNWRIAVVLLLTLAAVITPTVDVVSLSIVTLPLLILYWISVLVARLASGPGPRKRPLDRGMAFPP